MTSRGLEMPPDQKASQMRSIWLRMSPVSMGQFLCVVHQPPWARGGIPPARGGTASRLRTSRTRREDDVALGAADKGEDLALFGLGHGEVIETRLQVRQEHLPLVLRNVQMHMRVAHRTTRILLRTPRGPADHLGDEVLEPSPRHAMM